MINIFENTYFDEVYKVQKKYQNDLIHGLSERELVWIGQHNLCYTIGRGGNMNNVKPSFFFIKCKIIIKKGTENKYLPAKAITTANNIEIIITKDFMAFDIFLLVVFANQFKNK